MRAVLLRSLLVIGVGVLVLVGVLYVASTVDARAPGILEVRLTQPIGDEERVALITTSLEVAFSEPVERDSAEQAVRVEPYVAGAATWSGSVLTFTPNEPLELETDYRLIVGDGVRDAAGNRMTEVPEPFEFSTAGRPALAASDPADGATGVPIDSAVSLTFSTLMDTASVEEHLRVRPSFPHELRWSGEVLELVPTRPLQSDRAYEISVQPEAADIAGVALGDAISVSFRTVTTGLEAATVVPSDGVDGIAVTTPIAVLFDRPIDPDSVDAATLSITPEVAGILEVVPSPDEPPAEDGAGRMLRFTPAGALPPNTTFEVQLASTPESVDGGSLAAPIAWSFTTGAPPPAISNGITFISDRGGIPNVWLMNADGTGQRQISAELAPVVDYAIAPDGLSLVVADGRRLVYQRPDGADRRILTDDEDLEFDPTYSPTGDRIAFARADARSGEGLGIWEWDVGGGDATRLDLPRELEQGPLPSGGDEDSPGALRGPAYAPDGQALAYVDLVGWVGIVELPAERLTRAPFDASGTPVWLPDSSAILVTGERASGAGAERTFTAPVQPLVGGEGDAVHRMARSGMAMSDGGLGAGSSVLAVSSDGRVAYLVDGLLHVVDGLDDEAPDGPIVDAPASGARFAPAEDVLVVAFSADGAVGPIELVDLASGERTALVDRGLDPRWLP
jgi:Bacterial Ig-like domain/WD40-like Beta Propeller Repeat